MLNPCVCGTLHPEFDEPCLASPGSSPKKSKRKDSRNKNPYSSRGLDKFSELLAVLDEKRQKLYSQMNPHDVSIVRFVHSNTDDFVPIVVKLKNNNKDQKHKSQELNKVVKARKSTESSPIESTKEPHLEEKKQPHLESEKVEAKKRISWNLKNLDRVKPCFYLPMVMILILVVLTLFGKSVAILCTCILWYVIPTLNDHSSSSSSSSNPRWSMKKKDYVRGLSEKNMEVTKRKDYVRGFSEKKMEVNEGIKKKEYVRRWSEKIVATDPLSPRSEDYSEASKNKNQAKHSHKKSW